MCSPKPQSTTEQVHVVTRTVPFRDQRRGDDPQTPDVRTKCSKRCFDGLLRSWRRRLHRYDPPEDTADAKDECKTEKDEAASLVCPSNTATFGDANGMRGDPEGDLDVHVRRSGSPDAASFATPGTPTSMVRTFACFCVSTMISIESSLLLPCQWEHFLHGMLYVGACAMGGNREDEPMLSTVG